MQNTRLPQAKRIILASAAALGLGLLAGCQAPITNLTPVALTENPSHIYTISTRVRPLAAGYVPETVTAHIVIDGQIFPMTQSPLAPDIFTFDYQVPAGHPAEVAYYFITDYKYKRGDILYPAEEYSQVVHTRIASRYVLSMMANRGPVGSQVSIVGRGFTEQDSVTFDGTPARTVYNSPNSLTFFVPAVAASANYAVAVSGAGGSSPVGTFRVDPTNGTLAVSPTQLNLATGQGQQLTFTLPDAAPVGGQLLDVTTDIPESVIMPEVSVPAGQTSVTVTVTGGKPGVGSLVLKGFGPDITIPVTVK